MQSYAECPQVLRDFLSYHESIKGQSKRTVEEYHLDLRMFLRFLTLMRRELPYNTPLDSIDIKWIDTAVLNTVTSSEIFDFLSYLTNDRQNREGPNDAGIAAASRARKLSAIKALYKYLTVSTKQISNNPVKDIEFPKIRRSLPKYLTLEESTALLKAVDGPNKNRDFAILMLFLNCGIRRSELVGLNLTDVYEDRIRVVGKGNKERIVYLNDACVEALQLYLNKRNVMEGLSPKERAVFVTRRRKERISNRRVEQLVTGAMKAAGLKGFSTHKLRHTAATLMYQTGNVDILTLKQLLGHSSVGTTQIYTHLQEFQVRAAIEENPLGKASRKKPGKAALDTTEAETGESREELPSSTAEAAENSATAVDSSAPMAAFDGSAKEGFGLDTETLAANSDADTEK